MPFLFSLITIALMVFAVVDIIRRDDSGARYMPRFVWLLLVVLLPLLGSVLWFALGRVYPDGGIRLGRPSREASRSRTSTPPAPVVPVDTRTTEEQIADLDREIEEWRLRQEIEKRKKERGDTSASSAAEDG